MTNEYSSAYMQKCLKALEAIGAPTENWWCLEVLDEEYADNTCELCGCESVRFVHVMRNAQWFEDIKVGCICAGVMEGNVLAAVERERLARNSSKRRKNYFSKKWKRMQTNGKRYFYLRYKSEDLYIYRGIDGIWAETKYAILGLFLNVRGAKEEVFEWLDYGKAA